MAPAADMFEMGVKVQVLKRGTMFAMRAAKLYEFYRSHDSLEDIPAADRSMLEKTIFRAPLEEIWAADPGLLRAVAIRRRSSAASVTPSTRWPWCSAGISASRRTGRTSGEPSRTVDYQVWCGPAMAAFNEWVRGSFLEPPENRRVVTVALNILYGAAVLTRARMLAAQGVACPRGCRDLPPGTAVRLRSGCELLSIGDLPRTALGPLDPRVPPARFDARKGSRLDSGRFPATRSGGHHRNGLPVPDGRRPGALLVQYPRPAGRDHRGPAHPLAARGLLGRRPEGGRSDLRPAGRVPDPGRLPAPRLRHRPALRRGDRHDPAPGPPGGATGPAATPATARIAPSTATGSA